MTGRCFQNASERRIAAIEKLKEQSLRVLAVYYTALDSTAPFPVNPIEQNLHMLACTDTNTLDITVEIERVGRAGAKRHASRSAERIGPPYYPLPLFMRPSGPRVLVVTLRRS